MRHSVFTLEVCARIDVAPMALDRLRPLFREAPEAMTRDDAWRRHAAVAEVLMQMFGFVERGCWEYFDDEARAMAIFEDWCRPLLEPASRARAEVPTAYRSGGARYALVTMVYLLARDSPSDVEVRRACDLAPEQLWQRSTFWRLLGVVRTLSFASVKADAMYLAPRDAEQALTLEELTAERYEYLRPLERA